jgi:hypothetical protein
VSGEFFYKFAELTPYRNEVQSKANGIFAENIQSNGLYEMRRFVHKSVLFVVIFIISTARGFAQSDTPEREFAQVFFRQSATTIDTSYRDNEASLRRFVDVVNERFSVEPDNVGTVRIRASVSPEGATSINERIIRQRAESIVAWINQHADQPIDYVIELEGVDWDTLVRLIKESPEGRYLPYRSEVLALLRTTPESVSGWKQDYNYRLWKLSKLYDGEPYVWLKTYLFSELRYATAELVISLETETEDLANETACDTAHEAVGDVAEESKNDTIIQAEESAVVGTVGENEDADSELVVEPVAESVTESLEAVNELDAIGATETTTLPPPHKK